MTIDTTVTILPAATDILPAGADIPAQSQPALSEPAPAEPAPAEPAPAGPAPADPGFAGPQGPAQKPPATAAPAPVPCTAQAALGELAGVLAVMRRVDAAITDAPGWGHTDRLQVIGRLGRAIDGLTTVRAKVLIAERDSRTHKATGDGSFPK